MLQWYRQSFKHAHFHYNDIFGRCNQTINLLQSTAKLIFDKVRHQFITAIGNGNYFILLFPRMALLSSV